MKSLGKYKVKSVVDGDTIKVDRPPSPELSNKTSLRILNIDTEETTNPKFLGPVTQYGKQVTKKARQLFLHKGNTVELFGEGRVGFYNRPLVYVHFEDGTCYQEIALERGWTPYYCKYGWAHTEYHEKFLNAVLRAIQKGVGIWSKELLDRGNKGRPYNDLKKWWRQRALRIDCAMKNDSYKVFLPDHYNKLTKSEGELCTVFGELQCYDKDKGMFSFKVCAKKKFYVYVPKKKLSNKIFETYIGEDMEFNPRYVYVQGLIEFFESTPEIEIHDEDQISCRLI